MENIKENQNPLLSEKERARRKREIVLIIVIIIMIALMTFVANKVIHFGTDIPISGTILMFILINTSLLLLIVLIFLVFRNLVKLLYDRKRRVMGSKLRVRLVISFIGFTFVPTILLFFFSITFISASIKFWFNIPVEQALENSLFVGRSIYKRIEENNSFFLERVAYQIQKRNLLIPSNRVKLSHYIQVVQKSFNLDAVEIYSRSSERLTFALSTKLENIFFGVVSANDLQQKFSTQGIKSISEIVPNGEMLKTIGTLPFGVEREDAEAFIVITILVPVDLSQKMKSISRGFEEYQQIKFYKQPIKRTFFLYLSIASLFLIVLAIWFGLYLAKTISVPIQELADGTRRVADGNLEFSIARTGDDEIGSLVESFNKMTKELRHNRNQLELSANKLREINIEIEERQKYMEIVLENVSAGVISLDAKGFISTINKSAEKMLKLKAEDILNKNYKDTLTANFLGLSEEIMGNLSNSPDDTIELPVKLTIDGKPKSLSVTINKLKDDAGRHLGIVVVFDDLTELEKGQRMAAWREVARRIAHEVKNPLTPITLSAQRLNRKFSTKLNNSVFNECIEMIVDHVEMIRNLVNEFSSFARFPTANPKPHDLSAIIDETVVLYKEGHPNIDFKINTGDKMPNLNLDRQQIKQAMINLLDNAIGAIEEKGIVSISLSHDPILKMVRLEVSDNGRGINDEDKTRLFEPYYSTKKTGMGLGLTIVSAIISDHNGTISVQDQVPQGAKFVIELPV
ncbi:MAG: HAMP domain-containing protein [Deltaproteobacteria bacterium]|nr:HAMP domain-containing protein [Deltaproteobacteria bacterium]